MTDKLKYKVGDKVLIEAKVTGIDDDIESCAVRLSSGVAFDWIEVNKLEDFKIHLLPKVPQAVMEYYTQNISADYDYDEWFERSGMPDGIASWLYYDGDNDILMQRQHALATLITYGPEAVEVEKEKRYRVRIKDNLVVGDTLTKNPTSLMFTFSISDDSDNEIFTKNELEGWGFGTVFDNPMFEVEEVE